MGFCGIHLRVFALDMSLQITSMGLKSHLTGTNWLMLDFPFTESDNNFTLQKSMATLFSNKYLIT